MEKVEILSVGTELLMGQIANTNAQYLSRKLPELGLGVYYHSVVGDNPQRLADCLALALRRSDIVILTGGLGPTQDDLTKETVAKALGLKMVLHEESKEKIRAYFLQNGRTMTENNYRQAYFPEGSRILENEMGTAPGCALETERDGIKKRIILLPGPPKELIPMYEKRVVPYLRDAAPSPIRSVFLRIACVGESLVEQTMLDLVDGQTNPTVATYAKDGIVTVRVSAVSDENGTAEAHLRNATERIQEKFGPALYSDRDEEPEEVLVHLLAERGLHFSAAESCTGGMIAQRITSVSGASAVLGASFVTYSNEMKKTLLGVSPQTLQRFGAVSGETALEMVRGACRMGKAEVALSVTGCAGPSASEGKPVGLVYIGVKYGEKEAVHEMHFTGNREKIRTLSTVHALNLARLLLLS